MSNEAFKSTPRTRRFEEIARGVSHGDPQAALAFDILSYVHILRDRANDNDPGIEMARFDLQAKFAKVVAMDAEERTRNPYFADIARVCRRQRVKTADGIDEIISALGDAAAEFVSVNGMVAEQTRVVRARNPGSVRYHVPYAGRG